jgi:hypothetical protein
METLWKILEINVKHVGIIIYHIIIKKYDIIYYKVNGYILHASTCYITQISFYLKPFVMSSITPYIFHIAHAYFSQKHVQEFTHVAHNFLSITVHIYLWAITAHLMASYLY